MPERGKYTKRYPIEVSPTHLSLLLSSYHYHLTLGIGLPPPVLRIGVIDECQIRGEHYIDHVPKGKQSPYSSLSVSSHN